MQYLVARYDTDYKISYPPGTRELYEMNNWLFFQNAGVGPMQGQASKWIRYRSLRVASGERGRLEVLTEIGRPLRAIRPGED